MAAWLWLAFVVGAAGASGPCAERLLADPRFHWMPGAPDLARKPPDVFESKLVALMAPHLARLPRGLTPEETKFYGGIFELLRDRGRVFALTRAVVADLARAPGDSARARFEHVLKRFEDRHGVRVLEVHGAQSAAAWLELLAQGYTFVDLAEAEVGLSLHAAALNRTFHAHPGRWRHGAWSHRLQLHLVLRDLEANAAAYGSPASALDLYRRLGDRARTLDWSETGLVDGEGRAFGPRGLFYHLFDSAENNPSSPGYFKEYREYWPELPL